MSAAEPETQEPSSGESFEEDLDRDDIFHILQCRRRRLVLKYLQEYDGDGPASMSEIAEHIAARENNTTVTALRSQERQRVYIALYQSHLPKMDKVGVINYEQYRGHVKPTERTAEFERYLFDEPSLLSNESDEGAETESTNEAVDEAEPADEAEAAERAGESAEPTPRWSRRYLFATGIALVALAGAALGIGSPLVIAALVTGMFGLLAGGHVFTEYASTGEL